MPEDRDRDEVEIVLVIGPPGDPSIRGFGPTPEAAWKMAVADMADTVLHFDDRDDLPENGADIVRAEIAGSAFLRVRGPAAALARVDWHGSELSLVREAPTATPDGAA
jgi:O-glycosyl hydrolase